jgi:hypothetical protein
MTTVQARGVYMVLSAKALPYAEKAIDSLFRHVQEPVSLTLVTDGASDKVEIERCLRGLQIPAQHAWQVFDQAEADERAELVFADHPNLRAFRQGHPCWRKITDPLLFADPGAEIIVLDPDLYFPNHFTFEPTPASGLYLMWQPPSCLLPHETVMRAYELPVRLAHHVDIGVAQLRNNLDLAWLDGFVAGLGGVGLPRAMHIEAIVWAALAMRMGGGYFDPAHWYCWQYRQWKRVRLKLGMPGTRMLAMENLAKVKCFHASGIAKWWVRDASEQQRFPPPRAAVHSLPIKPFEDMPLATYQRDQWIKSLARRLGYYRIMKKA